MRINRATIILCGAWVLMSILIYGALRSLSGEYYAARRTYTFEKETTKVEWEESMETIAIEFQIPSLMTRYSVKPTFLFEVETNYASESAERDVLISLTFSCNGRTYFQDFIRAAGDVGLASGLYSDAYLNSGESSPELTDNTLLRSGANKLEVAISIRSEDPDYDPTTPPANYTRFTMSEVRVKVEPKDFALSPFLLALIGMVGLPAIFYIGRRMDKRR